MSQMCHQDMPILTIRGAEAGKVVKADSACVPCMSKMDLSREVEGLGTVDVCCAYLLADVAAIIVEHGEANFLEDGGMSPSNIFPVDMADCLHLF